MCGRGGKITSMACLNADDGFDISSSNAYASKALSGSQAAIQKGAMRRGLLGSSFSNSVRPLPGNAHVVRIQTRMRA